MDFNTKLIVEKVQSWIERLEEDQRLKINIREEFPVLISPSDLDNALEYELGWEEIDKECNGWQCDCWFTYHHPEYGFDVYMYFSGFYGDLELYRTDIDD